MTRAQRLEAAQAAWSDPDSGADGLAAALDAALADLGGLDGLERLDWRDRERRKVGEDWRELRADRDRLREALRVIALSAPGSLNGREAERVLADSDAQTERLAADCHKTRRSGLTPP